MRHAGLFGALLIVAGCAPVPEMREPPTVYMPPPVAEASSEAARPPASRPATKPAALSGHTLWEAVEGAPEDRWLYRIVRREGERSFRGDGLSLVIVNSYAVPILSRAGWRSWQVQNDDRNSGLFALPVMGGTQCDLKVCVLTEVLDVALSDERMRRAGTEPLTVTLQDKAGERRVVTVPAAALADAVSH